MSYFSSSISWDSSYILKGLIGIPELLGTVKFCKPRRKVTVMYLQHFRNYYVNCHISARVLDFFFSIYHVTVFQNINFFCKSKPLAFTVEK